MLKEPLQKPTASELEILRVLWARGPSTVREVHEALSEKKSLGYTTVLKLLQIMTAKGTVRRDEGQRAHVYEACQPRSEEHTSELQSLRHLVCRLLLEKKKNKNTTSAD